MRRSVASTHRSHNGTPCIECFLATSGAGYPVTSDGSTADGTARQITAALAVWEHHNGRIPTNMVVCHDCNNPACVNIEHLSIGTRGQKAAYSSLLGRTRNGRAKLTDAQVLEIARRAAAGERNVDLADEFGIVPHSVCNIKTGKTWRRLTQHEQSR